MLKSTPRLQQLIEQAQGDPEVLAVLLFGSVARGEQHQNSDVDVCLVLYPGKYLRSALTEKRLKYLTTFPLDVQIFQELPLYIRHRILQEGKVLFCKDEDILYTLAYRTVKAFADFEPLYRRYLEEVARAGS